MVTGWGEGLVYQHGGVAPQQAQSGARGGAGDQYLHIIRLEQPILKVVVLAYLLLLPNIPVYDVLTMSVHHTLVHLCCCFYLSSDNSVMSRPFPH